MSAGISIPRSARRSRSPSARRRERGYSLIELSVAILIALFLIGGVIVVEQGVHTTYNAQSGLAKLQNEERFAMSVLSNVIDTAGYFPDPTSNSIVAAFPAAGSFQIGQTVYGPPSSASAPYDQIYVRFMTAPTDNMDLCDGTTSSAAGNVTYTSYFYVAADPNGNGDDLYCQVETGNAWGTAVPLVSGISNMQIYYGVNTTGTDNNVDTYFPPASMNATRWQNVTSVVVTLTFTNPLANVPGQPSTVKFRKVIGVMSRLGVS